MEIIRLSDDFDAAVSKAAGALRAGGVIVYPTDTLYGLGADAFSDAAVDRVYTIKGRDPQKPIHCVVADLAMAAEYAEINAAAQTVAEKFLPGALTLVLKKRPAATGGIARDMETIGIRIPNNAFCIALAKAFGRPYTTTSANCAGVEPRHTRSEVLEQLGVELDLAVDGGEAPLSKPSTVIDLTLDRPRVLREGAVPAHDILGLF